MGSIHIFESLLCICCDVVAVAQVPVTINVRNFLMRQLGSMAMFHRELGNAERDRGRLRKEYIALAWVWAGCGGVVW